MTLHEYLMLSDDDQWDTIWSNGRFLDIYAEIKTKYVLYAIDRFFVELRWDILKDELIGKATFEHGEFLDKYSRVPKEI